MSDRRLVYSTHRGKICPRCGHPVESCACSSSATPAGDGIVRVRRETKGRKGKGVTVITGVPLERDELADVARRLRKSCGSGGTVKDGVIEIQGDHRDRVVLHLEQLGFKVKRAG